MARFFGFSLVFLICIDPCHGHLLRAAARHHQPQIVVGRLKSWEDEAATAHELPDVVGDVKRGVGMDTSVMDRITVMRAKMCAKNFEKGNEAYETNYPKCLKFMKEECRPGKDKEMDGGKGEISTGKGYCSAFFPPDEPEVMKEQDEKIVAEAEKEQKVEEEQGTYELLEDAEEGATTIKISTHEDFEAGDTITVGGQKLEITSISEDGLVSLKGPLGQAYPKGTKVTYVEDPDPGHKHHLLEDAPEGATTIKVSGHEDFAAGESITIGGDSKAMDISDIGADGEITLGASLKDEHSKGTQVLHHVDDDYEWMDEQDLSFPDGDDDAKKRWERVQEKMDESAPMASQGYSGKPVAHNDQETVGGDWLKEFGSFRRKKESRDYYQICKEYPDNEWCIQRGFSAKDGYGHKSAAVAQHTNYALWSLAAVVAMIRLIV